MTPTPMRITYHTAACPIPRVEYGPDLDAEDRIYRERRRADVSETRGPTADPDAEAEAAETLRAIVAKAKGDDLESWEFALDGATPEQMDLRWPGGGETWRETLDRFRRERAPWQAARDLLERLLAEREDHEDEVKRLAARFDEATSELAVEIGKCWRLERDNARLTGEAILLRARTADMEAERAKASAEPCPDCRRSGPAIRMNDGYYHCFGCGNAWRMAPIIDPAAPRRFRWPNPSGAWRYGVAMSDDLWISDTGMLLTPTPQWMPKGLEWIDPEPPTTAAKIEETNP